MLFLKKSRLYRLKEVAISKEKRLRSCYIVKEKRLRSRYIVKEPKKPPQQTPYKPLFKI